jgi:hypothetical protein
VHLMCLPTKEKDKSQEREHLRQGSSITRSSILRDENAGKKGSLTRSSSVVRASTDTGGFSGLHNLTGSVLGSPNPHTTVNPSMTVARNVRNIAAKEDDLSSGSSNYFLMSDTPGM